MDFLIYLWLIWYLDDQQHTKTLHYHTYTVLALCNSLILQAFSFFLICKLEFLFSETEFIFLFFQEGNLHFLQSHTGSPPTISYFKQTYNAQSTVFSV